VGLSLCCARTGSTAPATPAAVQLLKLQSQQRTRNIAAPASSQPRAPAGAAVPARTPAAASAPVAATSSPDLAGQLNAFEALTSPLAAAVAAEAYADDDDNDESSDGEEVEIQLEAEEQEQDDESDYDDDDDDSSDASDAAVDFLKTRHQRPGSSSDTPSGEQKQAALSRGASAGSIAMAAKLDQLSAEHAQLSRELSTK
jgi:hypothetical protein